MERLPTEILEMIGTFVDDKPTQRALTETSVEFHTLFTPRLYSPITLPSIWTPVQFDLIRRLCSSPELASLVHHFAFRIRGYDNYGKDELPQRRKEYKPFIDELVAALCELGCDEWVWWDGLESLSKDAWACATLIKLTRLTTLKIALENNDFSDLTETYLARIWRSAAFRPQPPVHAAPFQCLKDLFLFQNRRQISAQTLLTSQHILYPLCFPALNHVSVCGHFNSWDYEQDLEKCLRHDKLMITNCPVKEVTIWLSIYSNTVIQWFRQSINLERLNLVISQVKRKPPRITVTDYSRQVLLMVKDTLKSLSIRLDERLRQGLRVKGLECDRLKMSIFPWSSLKDLCALEHLTIPHVNLTGLSDQRTYEGHPKFLIDHFPASLKTLKITDIGFHYITALLLDVVGLVKQRTSMPSLVSVSLEAFTREDSRLTFCDNFIFWYRSHNDPRIKGQVRLDIGQDSGLLIQHNALKPYTESYTFRFFKGANHLDAASFARLASSVNDEVSVTINIQPAPSYIEEKKEIPQSLETG